MLKDKLKKYVSTTVVVIGAISSLLTIFTYFNIPSVMSMIDRIWEVFSNWYCLMPFIFIFVSIGIYFVMKFWLFLMRSCMLAVTKTLGNQSMEVRASDYCLVFISGVLYFEVFMYFKEGISNYISNEISVVMLMVVLLTVVITAFVQSAACLLFGYGYIKLTLNAKLLPQILHGLICIEWIVLVIAWNIAG